MRMFLVHMEFGEKLAIFNQKNLKAEKSQCKRRLQTQHWLIQFKEKRETIILGYFLEKQNSNDS